MGAEKTVLLAEDSEADADLLVESFEERRVGAELVRVRDGERALEAMLNGDRYDLVLLDLRLPKLSGEQVLRRARDAGTLPSPVVVLTGSSDPAEAERCLSLGAAAFRTKPTMPDGYLALVDEIRARWL